MTESRPLRVGLIGAGMITHHHLIGWSKVPEAQVVAVCDPIRERAEERAQVFAIDDVYDSMEDLLASKAVDAVDIATPRETHAAMVRQALARGLAVLCQKPLAPTLAEARGLVDDAEGQIRLMVHENWRFRP
ncbi:MAG: Gfo/Idh/MocA family protein, partial [Hyphomicrobiaceae bacterium]